VARSSQPATKSPGLWVGGSQGVYRQPPLTALQNGRGTRYNQRIVRAWEWEPSGKAIVSHPVSISVLDERRIVSDSSDVGEGPLMAASCLMPNFRAQSFIDSSSHFHRYWWDWQRAASQGATCTRGLRITRPKAWTIAELTSSPQARLRPITNTQLPKAVPGTVFLKKRGRDSDEL
jgi:hypothetical protein